MPASPPVRAQHPSGLFDVSDKVVVVTGGSRGMGRAIARGFAEQGARVYICSRTRAECAEAAADVARHGVCIGIPADLSTVEGCRDFASEFGAYEDCLDVLVNNAGTIWSQALDEYSESGWSKVFDINVQGVFFLTQSLLPSLRRAATQSDPARIVNIGSIAGFRVPEHDTFAYSASKAAVHQLTRHLASRLAGEHVTVNAIAPGRFRSDMLEKAIAIEGEEALLAPIPLGRFVEDDDLIGSALFLSSAAGSAVTGTVLPVDCGYGTL